MKLPILMGAMLFMILIRLAVIEIFLIFNCENIENLFYFNKNL